MKGKGLPTTEKMMQQMRLVAILEGISYLLLLFVAMPAKYLAGQPELVRYTGMVHGWLFVLYVFILVLLHFRCRWSLQKTMLGFVLSLVPFGTFYAERKLFR